MTEHSEPARRVTLADVASHAGVSKTTASFVLSDRPDHRIPTETADRVVQAARILGYLRPSRVTPAPAQLPVLAMVGDTVATDPFTGDLVRGAISAAADAGHGLIAADTGGDPMVEASIIADLLRRGVTRFLYASSATRYLELPQGLHDHEVVLLNCLDESAGTRCVVPDELAAGGLAARVLLDAGRPGPIWLVGEVTSGPYAGQHRLNGLVGALAAAGHRVTRRVDCRWWPPEAREALARAMDDTDPSDRPTSIVALNDRVALGCYQALAALGVTIPTDVSVISFDNSDLAWWLVPQLTSIDLPYAAMGRRAVELLMAPAGAGSTVERLEMRLHARGSILGS